MAHVAPTITLLYFDGCPSWRQAQHRAVAALGLVGRRSTELELIEVTTPEQAERLCFRGSPTFLVDGVDPFADPAGPVELACLIYRSADGTDTAPSVEQLVEALAGR